MDKNNQTPEQTLLRDLRKSLSVFKLAATDVQMAIDRYLAEVEYESRTAA
jgi:hypothetical protein